MDRFFVFFFLSLACVFVSTGLVAQDTGATDETGLVNAPFAVTPEEKDKLLEKAQGALIWFRMLDRESKADLLPVKFREHILPMELMQAAAILKEKEKPEASRMLREMLVFLQPTRTECFEIEERLGPDVLASFQEDRELAAETADSTTRIQQGAAEFLKRDLLPAEKIALYHDPQSAFDLMKAIDVLATTGRPMLTRFYLRRFLEVDAEPAEYAEIADQIGSRNLMQLAKNESLAPQGREAVAKIFAEAKKHRLAPETIGETVDAWEGLDENGRPVPTDSVRKLWQGDRLSLVALIEKLGQTQDEKEANDLAAVILSFQGEVREALAESLQSKNETLVSNSARTLASILSEREIFVLYPLLFASDSTASDALRDDIRKKLEKRGFRLPDAEHAAALLHQRAVDFSERNRPLRCDVDGYVRFWNWDDATEKVRFIRMTVPAAYRLYAYREANRAYQILPENPTIRRLYLTTLFERTAHRNGLDNPLDPNETGLTDKIENLSVKEFEKILDAAIEKEQFGAAQVAAQLLGKQGNAEKILLTADGRPSSLVRATAAKNRRVRFAALSAVMGLNPKTPYPGSSYVAEALTWFSRADGRRVLVSAHPKQALAAKAAGYFIALGYKGEIAMTSRDAMRQAADSPDVELMVIDLLCSEPSVPNIVQEMRNDTRTHDIPIAVLTDKPDVLDTALNTLTLPTTEKIDRLNPDYPFAVSLSLIYPRIVSDAGAAWVENDLFEKTGAESVPPEIRLQQARQTLDWIREIVEAAAEGPKIYHFEELDDIVNRALRSDVRINQGLALAAVIRSGAMQNVIYDIASDSIYPMEMREKAAEYFEQSIDKFGVLLRGKQVQKLYDRYNASRFEPKETQDLLNRLIDLLEDKVLD